ncbi:Sugar phosphate permease [Mycolicibacterium neoaurum]|uniref:MFS transporter n=1 Tax=Mycolicibacterium neoaurum TaxID=1795 RepID=UPI00088E09B6|nr:MFS transporter [Mycolicibacterium neoaurum]SDC06082.1 Sugar phosphate permease [Mycolicibacterium neoaurum]
MSNNRWVNLSAAYLALVAGFLPYVGWSPSLGAISEDLGLSYSQAGGISSVTGLVGGVMILLGGVIATRWGSKSVIAAGLASGVIAQVIFALSEGFALVIVARVFAGIAVGFLWVATYTMAVGWFRDSKQTGRAVGIMMSGDGVGAVLSLFAFSAVMGAFGWRMGLNVQAVCLAGVLLLVLVVSKNAPTAPAGITEIQHSSANLPTIRPTQSAVRSLLNRNVVLATIFWIGGVGLFSTIASWMPAILVENAGYSEAMAGLVTSLFSIAGMVAAFGGPLIAERLGSKKHVILIGGVVTVFGVAVMTVCVAMDNYLLVALCIPVLGLGVYAGEPLILAEAVESVRAEHSGVVNGVVLGLPWIVSGFAYPYILGLVKDATGSFTGGFVTVTIATLLLCAVSPVFIKEVHPVPVGDNSRV